MPELREVTPAYTAWKIAEGSAQIAFLSLPENVIHVAKLAVLDSVGCMAGGSTVEPGRKLLQMLSTWASMGGGVVVGSPARLAVPHAAYANAYLANVLDYDDTYDGLGHPGAPIVAAALAAGEAARASGSDLLAAVVAGYEVCIRIADAIRPSPDRIHQVWGQGTILIFGAAVAAGRLLGLGTERLVDALGLAGVHAPVPAVRKFGYSARPLSWIKNNFGWTSMGGVLSAQLAGLGFGGNRSIFDGAEGFWVMASSDRCEIREMTDGLGTDYRMAGLSFKPYPACRYIHTTLDALTALVNRYEITPERVDRIIVRSAKKVLDYADYTPRTLVDGQFSIPYLAAMVILRRSPGYAWSDEASLSSPTVATLARKVAFEHNPAADTYYRNLRVASEVEVRLADGTTVSQAVTVPSGDPQHSLSTETLAEKFLSLAEPVLGPAQSQTLLDTILSLEAVQDISEIMPLAQPGQ